MLAPGVHGVAHGPPEACWVCVIECPACGAARGQQQRVVEVQGRPARRGGVEDLGLYQKGVLEPRAAAAAAVCTAAGVATKEG